MRVISFRKLATNETDLEIISLEFFSKIILAEFSCLAIPH